MVVDITDLAGTGFLPGATVRLVQGTTAINATNVDVPTTSKITCKVDLTGAPTGVYDVIVKNQSGQEVTLSQSFTVTPPCGSGAHGALFASLGLISLIGIRRLRPIVRRRTRR